MNSSKTYDSSSTGSTRMFLQHRSLYDTEIFDVPLILELKYVSEEAASEIETMNSSNIAVWHFCEAVRNQVSRTVDFGYWWIFFP